ncbi:MinD/ParA family ATP-binding protein [Thermococcus sp.]
MVSIVVTGRGGAGKTTMTANLSVYFAGLGFRTLAVDGDLYLPKLAFHFGIYNPRTNLHTLLSGKTPRLLDSIYRDVRTGVEILPGSSRLYDVLNIDQRRLRRIVREAQRRYDLTIIDSPVGIPFDTISTFRLAKYQLIIVEVERGPIHSFEKMLENEVGKLKALGEAYGLRVGVLINKVRESKPVVGELIEYVEKKADVPVVGVVSYDPKVPESQNIGQPLLSYAPRSRASKEIISAGNVVSEWLFGGRKREVLERLEALLRFLLPFKKL